MNEAPTLSVVTTTDPRAKQLPFLLQSLSILAKEEKKTYEIIIIDDLGEWLDSTPPKKDDYPGLFIKTQTHHKRKGQLWAILTGIDKATAPLILTIDPDLHSCVKEIPEMIKRINSGKLALHCVRLHRPNTSRFRLIASTAINFIIRKISGIEIQDIGSSMILFNREIIPLFSSLSNKKRNPKIELYKILGDKLDHYDIKEDTEKRTPSHHSVISLISITLSIFRGLFTLKK